MRKASLLIFVGALFLSISTSWAASTPPQDITFDCHIEDIPLTKALQQLSEQSHQALIANPAHIQNFRSAPCQGLMNIESALQLILSNTGLVFKKTADNIFIITPQSNTQDQSRNASEIIITGIRHSVESALDIKNNANTFKDAIAQENVGKLPDDNIADAMQRITGVQIRRNNLGEGAAIQVRGFSQNRVEINNKTLLASASDDRENNFDILNSSFFKNIEVIKSASADMVEGAIGATIRLNTLDPLTEGENQFSSRLERTQNSPSDQMGFHSINIFNTFKDVESLGRIGLLLGSSLEKKNINSKGFISDWEPLTGMQGQLLNGYNTTTLFRPATMEIADADHDVKKHSFISQLHWQVNDKVNVVSGFMLNKALVESISNRLIFSLQDANAKIDPLTLTQMPSSVDIFTRPARQEYVLASDENFQRNTQDVQRGIINSGVLLGNNLSNPLRVALSTIDVEQENKTWNIALNVTPNERLKIETGAHYAISEQDRKNYNFAYVPNFKSFNSKGNFPSVAWHYPEHSDFPAIAFGENTNSNKSLLNPLLQQFQWYDLNGVSGVKGARSNQELSYQADFDLTLDKYFITTLEFGLRASNNKLQRSTFQFEHGSFGLHSIFSGEWRRWDQIPDNAFSFGAFDLESINQLARDELGYSNFIGDLFSPHTGFGPSQGAFPHAWLTANIDARGIEEFVTRFYPGRKESAGNDGIYCHYGVLDIEPSALINCEDDLRGIAPAGFIENKAYPYTINEQTSAFYAKLNFDLVELSLPVRGDLGVRWVGTDTHTHTIKSVSFIKNSQGELYRDNYGDLITVNDPVSVQVKDSRLLPSMNLRYALNKKHLLRLALAKTMARANPGQFAPAINLPQANFTGDIGNPYLKPFIAQQQDIAWEYYSNHLQAGITIFHKSLLNFIEEENAILRSQTDRDGDGKIDINDTVTLRKSVNGGDGRVNGLEFNLSGDARAWKGWLNGFGFQTNYTYIDSAQKIGFSELTGDALPVPNLSKHSGNVILFYEKNRLSFRLAYNFRDVAYLGQSFSNRDATYYASTNEIDKSYLPYVTSLPRWSDAVSTVDLSADLDLHKNIAVYFHVANAFNSVQRQYVGTPSTKHLLQYYQEIGTTYSVGLKWHL